MTDITQGIYQTVLEGDIGAVPDAVQKALDEGISANEILDNGLIAAMKEVGRLFEEGEYFVPEMLISARAMQGGLNILKPHLVDSGVQPKGKVIIGTVKGDLHDIGKNLVSMMLEGAGYEVVDLGTDVSSELFVEKIKEGADIVGFSALLTTTMPSIETTIQAINDAGLRDSIKIMVGGAPVTQEYADEIGADGFAVDASRAVTLAKSLIQ
ncbi:MAG: corrinoid protein [Chloroflexi bacterium]|nr:corrinoid protein [Chloroflexota bacterium]